MRRFFPTLFLVALTASSAPAQGPHGGADQLAVVRLQDWMRILGFELTLLQNEVLPELIDPGARRNLAEQVGRTIVAANTFERSLIPGVRADLLQQRYQEMDRQLHRLLEDTEFLANRIPTLRHSVKRLRFADEQMAALLVRPGGPDDFRLQAIRRQAESLDQAARDLYQAARLNLGGAPQAFALRENCRKFQQAAGIFLDRQQLGDPIEVLRRDYVQVDRSWRRLSQDINALPDVLGRRLHLPAERIDAVHARLCGMLGIEGGANLLPEHGDETVRRVLALLQGPWFVTAGYNNGRQYLGPNVADRMIFDGNRWIRDEKGTITASGFFRVVEVGRDLVKLEMFLADAPRNAPPIRAIIRMEGKILRYAHLLDSGSPFPATFQPRLGDRMLSVVWQRVE